MCHVLVIEDDWIIAEYVADLAEQAGATSVEFATTQSEAVERAAKRTPGIILSDVNLLEGKGPAAVQSIHQASGLIPVIFITGSPEQCDPCGPPAVILEKPVDVPRFFKAFKQMAPL